MQPDLAMGLSVTIVGAVALYLMSTFYQELVNRADFITCIVSSSEIVPSCHHHLRPAAGFISGLKPCIHSADGMNRDVILRLIIGEEIIMKGEGLTLTTHRVRQGDDHSFTSRLFFQTS